MGSQIFSALDHVVLLLSTPDFEDPPDWLKLNFNILDGGNHTFQPSRNKLIVFSDGTYIELFNWTDQPAPSNAWADSKPGFIDFALTSLPSTTPEAFHDNLNGCLQQAENVTFSYEAPHPGGRTRNDSVEVKWKLSRPVPVDGDSQPPESSSRYRKDLPFFCHDVTARNLRVPFDDEEMTDHPCGATGIAAVELQSPAAQLQELIRSYQILLGKGGKADDTYHHTAFQLGELVEQVTGSEIIIGKDYSLRRNTTIRSLRFRTRREGVTSTIQLEAQGSDGLEATFFIKA